MTVAPSLPIAADPELFVRCLAEPSQAAVVATLRATFGSKP